MKQLLKKIANIIIDILVVLILIVSILVVMLSLTSKSSGVPNIFGIAPLSVQTESMKGTVDPGDLIFCSLTEIDDEFQKDDIVTFPIEINGEQVLNTHRIVEVVADNNIIYYKTQGDNKETNPEPDKDLQTSSTIVAKYTGTKIPGLGNVLSFIRTQLGFFLCILLPMIIFFIYEAVRVVMNLMAYSKEKAFEEAQTAVNNSELTEDQKKQAIEEYLASLGQQSNNAGNEPDVQTPADGNNSNAES